jgi:SNF2 family DNA or RNA helicase
MEPGTGKTSTVAEAIDVLMMAGFSDQVLIVAPLRVARSTWKEEFAKWAHLCHYEVACMVGTPEQRLTALLSTAKIKAINFENLSWLFESLKKLKKHFPFRIIVIDESSKLKSMRTSWQTSSKGKAFLKVDEGMRVKSLLKASWNPEWVEDLYLWELTGSPCANSLGDLWAQLFFIDGGQTLGRTYTDFDQRFWRTGWKGWSKELMSHSEEEIRKLIAPHVFTVRAEDYMVLGEEIETNIYIDLPDTVRQYYREMEKSFYTEIKKVKEIREIEALSKASSLGKMHQIANGAIYYEKEGKYEDLHTEKLQALESIIEESSGNPVIVVYNFKSDLEKLKKYFPKGKAFDKKQSTEDNFKAGKIPILFMHPASGGHGVDGLQYVCNRIVFFSQGWDNELRMQVIARIGKVRQSQAGFKRPCFIYNLLARDTIDEDILERVGTKLSIEKTLKQALARRGLE